MLHHTWGNAIPGILQPIHAYGWMGVDLFFVLSGYLIGFQLLRQYGAGRTPSLADFYVRRGFRILPAYVIVLAIYCLAPSLREQPGMAPPWRFLTFTMNLGFDRSAGAAFSHAWSLCVEEHFYLLFPLACILLMRRPSVTGVVVAAGGIIAAGVVARLLSWICFVGPAVHRLGADAAMEAVYPEYIYYPTYTRLDGLLVGVTLAGIKVFRPGWWAWACSGATAWRSPAFCWLLMRYGSLQTACRWPAACSAFPSCRQGLACCWRPVSAPTESWHACGFPGRRPWRRWHTAFT